MYYKYLFIYVVNISVKAAALALFLMTRNQCASRTGNPQTTIKTAKRKEGAILWQITKKKTRRYTLS